MALRACRHDLFKQSAEKSIILLKSITEKEGLKELT